MPPARKRAASSSPAASAPKRGISQAGRARDTTAAKDAEQVLVKCRELRAHLIEKAASKTTQVAVNTNIPPNILEVSELPAEHVLEGMESVALRIAQQVMAKQGFSLDIPSRASSNQVYVKEWDRIVLGDKRSSRSFLNVKVSRHERLYSYAFLISLYRDSQSLFSTILYRNLARVPLHYECCSCCMPS